MDDLFTWSEEYSVGVLLIDQQHKQWFALLNRLTTAMREGRGKDVLSDILEGVAEYISVHFAYEQKEMLKCRYPFYEDHMQVHDAYIKEINGIREKVASGQMTVSIELMTSLKNWLVNHVEKADKLYAPYMSAKKAA